MNLQNFYTLFECTSQMDCEGKVYTVIGMTCFMTTFPTWAWAGPLGIALLIQPCMANFNTIMSSTTDVVC